jgi:hypothetical protein
MSTVDRKQFECATFIVAKCNPDMNIMSTDRWGCRQGVLTGFVF